MMVVLLRSVHFNCITAILLWKHRMASRSSISMLCTRGCSMYLHYWATPKHHAGPLSVTSFLHRRSEDRFRLRLAAGFTIAARNRRSQNPKNSSKGRSDSWDVLGNDPFRGMRDAPQASQRLVHGLATPHQAALSSRFRWYVTGDAQILVLSEFRASGGNI